MTQQRTHPSSSPSPSAALLQAQARLLSLRTANRIAPQQIAPSPSQHKTISEMVAALPPHLGWESAVVTKMLRRRQQVGPVAASPMPQPAATDSAAALPSESIEVSDTVTVDPDIAMAMLRHKVVATGRLWYLLRAIDTDGRGWLPTTTVREMLTTADSPFRLCGQRQLRKLLAAGREQFWQQSSNRIWLFGAARVAQQLGVGQLQCSAVAFKHKQLLGPLADVSATLYASFHGSRQTTAPTDRHYNKKRATPIARNTIQKLTGLSKPTQRRYERRKSICPKVNIGVGARYTALAHQQAAAHYGRAAFQLVDHLGKLGTAGNSYMAWQLPNSYLAPQIECMHPTRRRRRLNRQLNDLLFGRTGNDQPAGKHAPTPSKMQHYCKHAADPSGLYWPERSMLSTVQIWFEST